MLHQSERRDRAGAGRVLPRLEVGERHQHALAEGVIEGLERGIAHPQSWGVPDHRLSGGDPEAAQLDDRAARLRREGALAPDHRGEVEQGGLLGREGDVGGEVVFALGDAVAQVLVVAGLARALDRLERHPKFADVVLVALELPLEVGVVAGVGVLLPIALNGREDLVLRQARIGREQRQHEAEQSLLDGDARGGGGGGHVMNPTVVDPGLVEVGGYRMARMSTTKTRVSSALIDSGAVPGS